MPKHEQQERELAAEMEFHVAELADNYERQGLTRKEALRRAKLDLGAVEAIKEECREVRGTGWLMELRQDVQFGWRMMLRSPIVTAAAVLSLALGIGANTAIYSLLHQILFTNLGVPNPTELALVYWKSFGYPEGIVDGVWGYSRGDDDGGEIFSSVSYGAYEELNRRQPTAGFMFSLPTTMLLDGKAMAGELRPVSGNFFQVLQTKQMRGRLLQPSDDSEAAPRVMVVTHRFWQSLGAPENLIGKQVQVAKTSYQIIGILEPGFQGLDLLDPVDLYIPLHQKEWGRGEKDMFTTESRWWVMMITRLHGQSFSETQTNLNAVWRGTWQGKLKDPKTEPKLVLTEGRQGLGDINRDPGLSLKLLLGASAVLLLIACANFANLLLARANGRVREVAVRVSLGATRQRLMRQFLTECALMVAAGGILGLLVAMGTTRVLLTLLPVKQLDSLSNGALPIVPMLVTVALTLVVALVSGMVPAWAAGRMEARPTAHASVHRFSRNNVSRALVVLQIALSIVLAVSAILLGRNLQGLHNKKIGYDHRNLLLFNLKPGESGYTAEQMPNLYKQLEVLRDLPQVEDVSLATVRPMRRMGSWGSARVRPNGEGPELNINSNQVDHHYFSTMQIPLLAGRNFQPQEKGKVVIISQELAEKAFGRENPIGKFLYLDRLGKNAIEIIGVVQSTLYSDLRTTKMPLNLYQPFDHTQGWATVIMRTQQSGLNVVPNIKDAISRISSRLLMTETQTMQEQLDDMLRSDRLFGYVSGAFAILGLLLSAIGVYGVMSQAAQQRRNEIGIRLALGARRDQIFQMLFGQGMLLFGVGLVLAAPAFYFSVKLWQDQLAELKALDPLSVISGVSALALAAALAAGIPAIRDSQPDPATTLRQD